MPTSAPQRKKRKPAEPDVFAARLNHRKPSEAAGIARFPRGTGARLRSMYEDERTALRVVMVVVVGCCVPALLCAPPPPPPPPRPFEGLIALWKAMARLTPSSVPSTEPSASTSAPSGDATTTPSSAVTVAPSAASRSGCSTRPIGIAGRKPGATGVVESWGPHE